MSDTNLDSLALGDQTLTPAHLAALITAVEAGRKKIAHGIHATVAASDTVDTGLDEVEAVFVQMQSAPSLTAMWATGDIGNQSGAPAAGSVLIKTWKPTAADDVTPIAATAFAKSVSWIAIGT